MKVVGVLITLIPILIVVGAILAGGAFYYRLRFKIAKSNQAYIISGGSLGKEGDPNLYTDGEGRALKIVRGGGHFLKWNQTATKVDLESMRLNLQTSTVFTKGGVPVIADAVAMVSVSDTKQGIVNYAEQFLDKDREVKISELTAVLGANLRGTLSGLTVEEINGDREAFSKQVTDITQEQLDKMGFRITSLVLNDLKDEDPENGYIVNLGRPKIAESNKIARISEVESEKEVRMYEANANKVAEEEEINRQIEIAESQKEKDMRMSAIQEDTGRARAKAEQAYTLEQTKLEKSVQEESLKLQAQKTEEELRIQQLQSERQVKIEEERTKVRQVQADADYYEQTKIAEAEARKSEIDGLAKAKIAREQGLAEAEVVRKRGEAEAESVRLKAEALQKHGEVILAEKMIEMIPLYAKEIAAPLSQIDSVKIIDTGSGEGSGLSSYGGSVTDMMLKLQEPLKEMVGLDLTELIKDVANRGNTHTVVRDGEIPTVNVEKEPEEVVDCEYTSEEEDRKPE